MRSLPLEVEQLRLLVTGGTGYLGSELLPLLSAGHTVFALYRKKHPKVPGVCWLEGDVTLTDLGLADVPTVEGVFHCAGLIDLSSSKKEQVWAINVKGTVNVLNLCKKHRIPRLWYVSTAYTQGRNPYEISKRTAEQMVEASELQITIYKIAIIAGNFQTWAATGAEGFYAVARIIANLHRRAEIVRRKVEGTLHLPPLELTVRLQGDPDATLNLVPVDWVAKNMLENMGREGVIYLTNPTPPTLSDVVDWLGQALYMKIIVTPSFKPTPIEMVLARLIRPFLPYMLKAEPLPVSVDTCPRITGEFIIGTVEADIVGGEYARGAEKLNGEDALRQNTARAD